MAGRGFTSETAKKAAQARLANLSAEQRREIARKGAIAKNAKYPIAEMSRLGGLAILEKLGRDGLADKVANWRKEHPSSLEVIVANWLDDLGCEYQREIRLHSWYADFYLPKYNLIIEVNGHAWHNENWHGENEIRVKRDIDKLKAWTEAKYRVLVLAEAEIKNGSAFEKLKGAIL
ncbi:MAG: hypothetical protein M0T85_07970 [Dehalococcoidales bacterium]|nr:hypothetical protein [Dehalococcoidales bacterium]